MTQTDTKTRILLVDDHMIVRESLACRLEDEPDLAVPHTAADAGEGLALAKKHDFDIVVMDIDMPGISCFDAARQLDKGEQTAQVVFLSAVWNDSFIEQATAAGACGMLSKSDAPEVLVNAIRTIVDGGVYFSDEVRSRLRVHAANPEEPNDGQTRLSMLTPRELEVLRAVGMGSSRKQMAQDLGISGNTVAVHTNRIMRKLDIHDRVTLARFAIKIGLSPL
ncbi:response regulator transcription factor [Phycisphaeraceae bacterium D3-23]